MLCRILRHATCELFIVWSSKCSSYEIDKGHAFIQNLSDPIIYLKKGVAAKVGAGGTQRATVGCMGGPVCVALQLYTGAYMRCGPAAFREIYAVQPLPLSSTHLPHPTSEFIFSLQQKEGPSWPFIFQFRAFLFLQINALQSTLTDVTLHHFHFDT